MNLTTIKVEYTCGLILTDRVILDGKTGDILLPPRLISVMAEMEESECLPVISVQHQGYVLPVEGDAKTTYKVQLPEISPFGFRRLLNAVLVPTKDQYQQNARLLHTFSAASIVGAVGYAHAAPYWGWSTVGNTASLACLGVILWYAGFQLMKGE